MPKDTIKRILIVTDCPTLNTGYARVGRFLANTFQDNGYEVIYLPCNTTDVNNDTEFNFHLETFDVSNKYCVNSLPIALDKYTPSLVITIGDFNNVAYVGNTCKAKNIKSLYYFPIEGENYPPEKIYVKTNGHVQSIDFKLVLLKFDYVITYSKFGQTQINKLMPGLVQDYVYHAVDTKTFRPLDRYLCRQTLLPSIVTSPEANSGTFIIGGVFRNMVRKGVDYFLKSVSRLLKDDLIVGKDIYAFLVTDPYDTKGYNLEKMIKDYDLTGRVIILPTTGGKDGPTDDQMCEIYNSFDILLAPSRAEGFGLVAVEAAACGTNVITTNYATPGELGKGLFKHIPVLHTEPIHTTNCDWAVLDIEKISDLLLGAVLDQDVVEPVGERTREALVEYADSFSEKHIGREWLGLLEMCDLPEVAQVKIESVSSESEAESYQTTQLNSYLDSLD